MLFVFEINVNIFVTGDSTYDELTGLKATMKLLESTGEVSMVSRVF